jgi:hypothetical protein
MDSNTQEKPNEDPGQPISQEHKAIEDDPILVALKRLVESKKEPSLMDRVGAMLQLLATLATLFFLIYGFVKFSNLDELAKKSETTSKVVTARYDKAFRINVDGDLAVDVDKNTVKTSSSLFSVSWHVSVKNLSKKPVLITLARVKCYIGKWPDQGKKEFFEHFGPPDIATDSPISWIKTYEKVSSMKIDEDAIKQTFGSNYDKFVNDQKDSLGGEQTVTRAFLTTLLEPDEGADETEGFLVRASRSDHVACDTVLRLCYEDENGQGTCSDGETTDSTHLWLANSNQNPKN